MNKIWRITISLSLAELQEHLEILTEEHLLGSVASLSKARNSHFQILHLLSPTFSPWQLLPIVKIMSPFRLHNYIWFWSILFPNANLPRRTKYHAPLYACMLFAYPKNKNVMKCNIKLLGRVTINEEVHWVCLDSIEVLKCSSYQGVVSAGVNLAFLTPMPPQQQTSAATVLRPGLVTP